MTLVQFIDSRVKAINANFKYRNDSVFIGVAAKKRNAQLRAQRRETIRRFIRELRAAKDPSLSHLVAKEVAWIIH